MPISTKSVFICDRDGVRSTEVDAKENMTAVSTPPEGWMRIMWDALPEGETVPTNGNGYLCPACVAAFRQFIGQTPSPLLPS